MVLQYFGSEKDIFAFKRNPVTFVAATLIVMLVLRLLTLLLEHVDGIWEFFFRKASGLSRNQRIVRGDPKSAS